ncbi:probable CDC60-leucine--tRNA ligase, cytosolic [Sporisorium reilianum f. sp. reilianum]|uniref:leucine--tRNA ligase n=1 Tax=Sporisorium reilianum f. sp. reilianum TaxID=72559 RepID=A0A2N8UCU1_9BASI|nr:probable CDC60-leucine--tRNA ligase, cytosolic [Sporisorium reilianum f. sp. reilianum]
MPPKDAAAAAAAAAGPIQLENTAKRDFLQKLEKESQQFWAQQHVFDINAPTQDEGLVDMTPEEVRAKYPKWFATIPYAYMNGSLHLGHAFTLSKVEFAAGYERMQGKRALFPWAFHVTGMPIRAAADKLVREIELFGDDFSGYKDPADEVEEEDEAPQPPAPTENTSSVTKTNVAKATKGKLAGKDTGLKYQFQIMLNSGVPKDEIKKFADANYWLSYFPPIAKADCTAFGSRIDWRRAFITTDANPYYDSFVRWQMNKLHAMDKIKFGERYTIYSPKDGQPCMDHDRSDGEGLGPQEYTGLKMELVQWGALAAPELDAKLQGKKVYFVAATLRPETMYGQTNCYVGPTIDYGAFQINDTDVYICTERAARNMAFQGTTKERGQVNSLATVKGSQLIGTKIKAPFGLYPEVYVLPMESVLATKGTGVVTSVPSDSPDDYATLMDLRKKAEYYKIDPQWAAFEPIPVIRTPAYGDLTAETLVKQLKIQSAKDKNQLAEAKELAYKEGFYNGTMLVGSYKGEPVQEAKNKVRDEMIKANLAFAYAEPEGKIISRSADECVVALCDQWYMDYGEESWKAKASKLIAQMNTFGPEVRNAFEGTIDWLKQWACARSYGLGSKLPWDPQYLVESLSDSTIYMSYYTIAHHLQGGVADGSKVGPIGIKAEELTDEIWDYILGDGAFPADTTVPKEKAEVLRREFRYFYPMDLRSSGKDLIPNHLTFCVYVHSAIFPEHHWPKAIRANGHLMLNGKKMSKSTGNSLSLRQSVEKFGADATRLSLADAGDGIEDANFEEKTANANILRLHTLIDWCAEVVANQDKLRSGAKDSFWDKSFENQINNLIQHTNEAYEKALYKDATKYGFYELQTARDLYREATSDIGMHVDLVLRWIRTQALLITPIAPHFAEHVWRTLLGESTSIQTARWPEPSARVDNSTTEALAYVSGTVKTVRDAEILLGKKAKGKSAGAGAPVKYNERAPKECRMFVAKNFPEWQDKCVSVVQAHYDAGAGTFDDKAIREQLAKDGMLKDKKVMNFIVTFKKRIADFGAHTAFNRRLPFDEIETLRAASGYFKKSMNFQRISIFSIEDDRDKYEGLGVDAKVLETAEPGLPSFTFLNIEA